MTLTRNKVINVELSKYRNSEGLQKKNEEVKIM